MNCLLFSVLISILVYAFIFDIFPLSYALNFNTTISYVDKTFYSHSKDLWFDVLLYDRSLIFEFLIVKQLLKYSTYVTF